ncbi:hypothetical protein ABIB25_005834 [Nakamurella sp. UYEF19]|uniref:hypothetical protein n=1 Tax=Nakamurella sp. UYEF19 TaxID=1756392 RepID=UPI00339A6412
MDNRDNRDNWVLPPPRDLATLDQLDLDSLVGLSVVQARARVEEAGGDLRAVTFDEGITLDRQPRRVTVVTDEDRAEVVRVLGRG